MNEAVDAHQAKLKEYTIEQLIRIPLSFISKFNVNSMDINNNVIQGLARNRRFMDKVFEEIANRCAQEAQIDLQSEMHTEDVTRKYFGDKHGSGIFSGDADSKKKTINILDQADSLRLLYAARHYVNWL